MQSKAREPEHPTLDRLATAVYPSFAMLAGMQLGVFIALADDVLDVAAVAERLDVRAERLQPLLYALVAAGLLSVQDGRFRNTAEAARYLVRGRPDYLGDTHGLYETLWRAAMQAGASIRSGRPAEHHDFAAMSPERQRALYAARDGGLRAAGRSLAERYGFAGHHHLLDVGGAPGSLAMAACECCPGLTATVMELPNVVPGTRDFVAEHGMAGRVRVLAGDITAAPPEGRYDLAVLRAVVQVLSAEQAAGALRHVAAALEPGGQIVIVGRMLDDSRLSPAETVAFNLVFLGLYEHGEAYTEGEHRAWLEAAGCTDVRREVQPDQVSVMTARKA